MIPKLLTDLNNVSKLDDEPSDITGLTPTALKAVYDKAGNDTQIYVNNVLTVAIDLLDSKNLKDNGIQTVVGVKTFSESPIVPTPTTDYQVSTKKYIDDNFETKTDLSNTRKLSASGDFTGTLNGGPITASDPGLNATVVALGNTVNTHLADNSKQIPHLGTTTNSGDAYSITTAETILINQKFTITLNTASTTTPTLKINSGTVCAIKKANGNAAKLYASTYTLFWNGTNFIQLGEGGDYGTATADKVLSGTTIGTDAGVIVGTMPDRTLANTPAVVFDGTYTPGRVYMCPQRGLFSGVASSTSNTYVDEPNFIPSNIVSGKSIFGLAGTATITSLGGKRFTSSSSTQSATSFTIAGLAFQPREITVFNLYSGTNYTIMYSATNPTLNKYMTNTNNGVGANVTWTITSSGFTITQSSGWLGAVTWTAYE